VGSPTANLLYWCHDMLKVGVEKDKILQGQLAIAVLVS